MTEVASNREFIATETVDPDGVEIADAAIDAIVEDNPDKQVFVVDRGDYVRITTTDECRLTRASLEKHLGRDYSLVRLEIEMPSFAGRIRTTDNEYVWSHH